MRRAIQTLFDHLSLMALVVIFFSSIVPAGGQHISTRQDRDSLFQYLFEKTLERESFSPIKEKNLGIDVREEMRKCREDIVNATTDEELFFALVKLSSARKDRHLGVDTLMGGLELELREPRQAPIRFLCDFGQPDKHFFFVSDLDEDMASYSDAGDKVEVGDQLIQVNGVSVADYFSNAKPYLRYSTVNNLLRRFAYELPRRTLKLLPSSFYKKKFEILLEKKNGEQYQIELPYLLEDQVDWVSEGVEKYPGYRLAFEEQCFHVYLPEDPQNKTLLLWWYGFRDSLEQNIDSLIDYADRNDLLGHDLIIDLTQSRGGSRGAYALQRLSPKPFKTTFGNLKISDITGAFIAQKTEDFIADNINDNGARETDDGGKWVMDWLHNDVLHGLAAGQEYSNNVPFKCAHLPKYSDGIIQPAEKHFTGRMVCLFGPWGGSHLDQFASIVDQNDLAYTIGMPTGGYSNTWEWEEEVVFPISKKPVARFMWSIGHTIAPNGQIVEGNPAPVQKYIPLTRENFEGYLETLIKEAERWLASDSVKP